MYGEQNFLYLMAHKQEKEKLWNPNSLFKGTLSKTWPYFLEV